MPLSTAHSSTSSPIGSGPVNQKNLQRLAAGGLVTGPTLATIGDSYTRSAGQLEAAIPLDDPRAVSLCHLIWIFLHNRVRYERRGPSVTEKAKRVRTSRMIRTLRMLGYRVEPALTPP